MTKSNNCEKSETCGKGAGQSSPLISNDNLAASPHLEPGIAALRSRVKLTAADEKHHVSLFLTAIEHGNAKMRAMLKPAAIDAVKHYEACRMTRS